ncbi:D-alanine--D-alanine ligase family protein [Nakamurella endophytica]|uniref:D-alanine--D-alanine ligase n=1 Tax=Nakamurella endophytica TaxID=1748367 RepID=A0A917W9E8_9ACTN|nr:D-alanine--D-alanine ligase family protein [Nakamurella endophytica]GGL84966.1 D-alanine--D-alanine ligase [Nakamurella endophytica]
MGERIRVAVVFGGRSGEHAVSYLSARSVLAHLDPDRFEAVPVGITPDGCWLRVDPAAVLEPSARPLPAVRDGAPLVLRTDSSRALLALDGPAGGSETVDVVFPVLHGPFGEDGTIQGMLELAGLPYVGPGVLASAVGMDKAFTKKILAADGLPVGDHVVVPRDRDTVTTAERDRLGLPVFVKPARAGSSLGVTRVDSWSDLARAVAVARDADPKVLVEKAVPGREIECGVLEFPDGRVEASPTAEIHLPADYDYYDFNAKYLDDVATFDIPADLPGDTADEIRELAVRAFRSIDAQGLARVDFFVTPEGRPVINEVNTMPGFTPISMFPRMWQAGGLEYPQLLTVLIETALARGTGLR